MFCDKCGLEVDELGYQAMRECMEEELKQVREDSALLESIRKQIDAAYFENIKIELEESEHYINFQIVNEPIGNIQNQGDYNIWIDQCCGESGDDYSGTICLQLSRNKYFMWNYSM